MHWQVRMFETELALAVWLAGVTADIGQWKSFSSTKVVLVLPCMTLWSILPLPETRSAERTLVLEQMTQDMATIFRQRIQNQTTVSALPGVRYFAISWLITRMINLVILGNQFWKRTEPTYDLFIIGMIQHIGIFRTFYIYRWRKI